MSSNLESQLPQSKFGFSSNDDIISFLTNYFKIITFVYVIWLIGYLNFSISWLLLIVFLYLLREKSKKINELKSNIIKSLNFNEKETILARLDELPSWVNFPDKERTEWLNKIIKQFWPYLSIYLKKTIIANIEPIINQYSTFVDKIKFDEFDMGDIVSIQKEQLLHEIRKLILPNFTKATSNWEC
jgi:Ca2+-dependent lipid-binding protein